jgi:N-acetylglucosaminyldiphosphoundecaprenol N-acetyl-beta-D-mannosaminyltransferase
MNDRGPLTTEATAAQNRSTSTRDHFSILGVRVHALSADEAVRRISAILLAGGRHTIIPVNPEMIMTAQRNDGFRETINGADLALVDGIGVLLAARLRGVRNIERMPGSDTVELLASLAARQGLRLYLLGAAPGVAEEAGRRLQSRHRGLVIAGAYAGSPAETDAADICARIAASGADILFVAYGAPQQELWIARHRAQLPVRLAMPVGGTFDFLAGVASRAPIWVRRSGLEWLYRLFQEPRRYRRMLALPAFAFLALSEQFMGRP